MNQTFAAFEREQGAFCGNRSHLRRLFEALENHTPDTWNKWRKDHPAIRPNLRGVDLRGVNLSMFNLENAQLSKAQLSSVHAWEIQLANADLRYANIEWGEFNYADLRGANLDSSRLIGANLTLVKADQASFRGADLSHTILNGSRLQGADLTGARVAGTSAWNVEIDADTRQNDLIIDQWVDPLEDIVDYPRTAIENIVVKVDHLEAAHLLYLISTKGKFKTVIDALTSRVVLLLGNFSLGRIDILRAIQYKLADLGYAPVIFDFAAPADRDLIETVALIAGLSRFVIVDLTQPRSTPLESLLIAPQLMVPFASIIQKGERPFSMFRSLQTKYDWMLPTWAYRNQRHLIRHLKTAVINPCEQMQEELSQRRQRAGKPVK